MTPVLISPHRGLEPWWMMKWDLKLFELEVLSRVVWDVLDGVFLIG